MVGSGVFVDLGIKRFVWQPLERITSNAVPKLVVMTATFTIYLLALSGVVAFVFDMRLTSLLATSGMAAAIIGLALQMNLSNVVSGIALNIERPFKIGDWVKIGDQEGKVVDISWRSTLLETWDESVLALPNSTVCETPIHNYHYPDDLYWLWPEVQIDPAADPDTVKEVLKAACLSVPEVVKDDPPEVYVTIAEWSVDYCFAFAVRDFGQKWEVESAVWERVWYHLKLAGIELGTKSHEIYNFKGDKSVRAPLDRVVEEVPMLAALPETVRKDIGRRMRLATFDEDDIIEEQGASVDRLYIILSGAAEQIVRLEEGGEEMSIGRLGAGQVLGEAEILQWPSPCGLCASDCATRMLRSGARRLRSLFTRVRRSGSQGRMPCGSDEPLC